MGKQNYQLGWGFCKRVRVESQNRPISFVTSVRPPMRLYMCAASIGPICVKFYIGDLRKICPGRGGRDSDLVKIEQKYEALYMKRTPVGGEVFRTRPDRP